MHSCLSNQFTQWAQTNFWLINTLPSNSSPLLHPSHEPCIDCRQCIDIVYCISFSIFYFFYYMWKRKPGNQDNMGRGDFTKWPSAAVHGMIRLRHLYVGHPCLTFPFHKHHYYMCCDAFPIFSHKNRADSGSETERERERDLRSETTMSTLKVPQSVPPVADDCEQLRKAFSGLTILIITTLFSKSCFKHGSWSSKLNNSLLRVK